MDCKGVSDKAGGLELETAQAETELGRRPEGKGELEVLVSGTETVAEGAAPFDDCKGLESGAGICKGVGNVMGVICMGGRADDGVQLARVTLAGRDDEDDDGALVASRLPERPTEDAVGADVASAIPLPATMADMLEGQPEVEARLEAVAPQGAGSWIIPVGVEPDIKGEGSALLGTMKISNER